MSNGLLRQDINTCPYGHLDIVEFIYRNLVPEDININKYPYGHLVGLKTIEQLREENRKQQYSVLKLQKWVRGWVKWYKLYKLTKTEKFCRWYYDPENIGGKIGKDRLGNFVNKL